MAVFTTDELHARTSDVLAAAKKDGEARIRTNTGEEFSLRPSGASRSSLDVGSLNLGLSADEIVQVVREGRERPYFGSNEQNDRE